MGNPENGYYYDAVQEQHLPSGGGAKWGTNGSGEPPQYVIDWIDWLLTPDWEKEITTQVGYARAHDISVSTIKGWKRDPRVKAMISKRADEVNLSTEKIQQVISAVFRAAVQGDVKAATLYLQHADKLQPKRIVIEDRSIASMSDEELRLKLEAAGLLSDD